MKPQRILLPGLAALLAASLGAVSPVRAEDVPVTVVPPTEASPLVAVAPLEQLVAPIALYPDALIALILPAATSSSDVVLAARFLKSGGDVSQLDAQSWDDSVKGLAHYPDVLKWMDENLSWTQQLGQAYLDQPQAVMNAIQRARAQARANGVLVDTEQQQVVVEDSYIRIIPAQPNVIYVPRYDPQVIYVDRSGYYSPDPWLTFGIGFGVGSWLAYDLDWRSCTIWVDHHRHDHWRDHRDWRYRAFPSRAGFVGRDPAWRTWRPLPGRARPTHRDDHWNRQPARPSNFVGAPHFDQNRWRERSQHLADGNRAPMMPARRDQRVDVQTNSGRGTTVPGFRPRMGSNYSAVTVTPGERQLAPVVNNGRGTPPAQVNTTDPRAPSERSFRRPGAGRTFDRSPDRGSAVVVTPSNRPVPAQSAGTPNVPRVAEEIQRRRGPSENGADHRIRPAMPSVRQNSVSAPVPQAGTPVAVPAARPFPQAQREIRQTAPAAPARQAVSAPPPPEVRSAPPPVSTGRGQQTQSDRGGRSEGRGGRGRNTDR